MIFNLKDFCSIFTRFNSIHTCNTW